MIKSLVGKTFSFKNPNKNYKEKDINEENIANKKDNVISIFHKNKIDDNIKESDKDSVSFRDEKSLKDEFSKKEEKKNILFSPKEKEEEKSLFINLHKTNASENIFGNQVFGEKDIPINNMFGKIETKNLSKESERENHNINEIKQPSIFDKLKENKIMKEEKVKENINNFFNASDKKDIDINVFSNNNLFGNINNNNSLFGNKDNTKQSNNLFGVEKLDKPGMLFGSNSINAEKINQDSNTHLFTKLIPKSENEEKEKKLVEGKPLENKETTKSLFGNLGNTNITNNNNLFSTSATNTNTLFNPKPNTNINSGLFGENKTINIFDNKEKKEEIENKTKSIFDNKDKKEEITERKPLFNLPSSENIKPSSTSLFGAASATATSSLFSNRILLLVLLIFLLQKQRSKIKQILLLMEKLTLIIILFPSNQN